MDSETDNGELEASGRDTGKTDWREYFPYKEPYPEQADAIEPIQDTIDRGGFAELEGACGTGKTLIAILAGISKVRDPTSAIQRILVLTNVKQQIRIFEEDITAINDHLDEDIEPISSVTMVSKPDLCSYVDASLIEHEDLYSKCDSLRETIRDQVDDAPTHPAPILNELAKDVEVGPKSNITPLHTAEWSSPYEPEIPAATDRDAEYCPFYAQFRADQYREDYRPYSPEGVATRDEMMQTQSAKGVCPHARMAEGIEFADVVIGNYQHVFDDLTVQLLTHELLSPQTFVVADEAHNLVERARNELSHSVSFQTFENAIEEIEDLILDAPGHIEQDVWFRLADAGVSESDVEELLAFVESLRDQFREFVNEVLDEANPSWHQEDSSKPDSIDYTLGYPEQNKQDKLSVWGDLSEYSNVWSNLEEYAQPIIVVLEDLSQRDELDLHRVNLSTVQRVLTKWRQFDHIQYFRQLGIERRETDRKSRDGFERYYTARLELKNTIPRREIAERLNVFGAGLLMSATLQPFEVFEAETGLDILSDEHDRHLETLGYGLSFPEMNRLSLQVPLRKFTYTNRGPPNGSALSQNQERLRHRYRDAIVTVAKTTPGNVMVAMPSYREAEWAADSLRKAEEVDKRVLLDESSTDERTERLKSRFYRGDSKVLVTGLRGTLTEGVDYEGERLKAAVVIGLPIKATETDYAAAQEFAYVEAFGRGEGFTYAFQIPAVRKARQAYGRVIRGGDEVGARVLVDERYGYSGRWDGVGSLIPEYELEEFAEVELDGMGEKLVEFWE